MKLFFITAAVVLVTSFCHPAQASGSGLQNGINRVLRERCLNLSETAVMIVEADSGKVVFNKNGSKPLVPASVMKLVTTASALRYLGPDYRFKTDILYTGQREGKVITGDLIIRGGGDPKLTPESLWLIANAIKRRGVTEIKGGLVLDESFFDKMRRAPNWTSRRTQNPYDAKLGALSVNFNTVAVHVYPGLRPGDPLIVGLVPANGYFTVINEGKTVSRGRKVVNAVRKNGGGKVVIKVRGRMKPGDKPRTVYLNIDHPARYAEKTFRSYLAAAGIKIHGPSRHQKALPAATLLFTNDSEPLSVILRGLNRYSNNFVAEQILKTIAAEITNRPGSHEEALSLNLKFLAETGVDMSGVVLADGSGLSRKNRLTASAVTGLLSAMSRRYDIGPDFEAALGIMGVDGSVKKRLKSSPARRFSRAKTGTLNGISALAGYVQAKNGKVYAFTIFLTKSKCYYKKADAIEDAIVTAVHLFGGK